MAKPGTMPSRVKPTVKTVPFVTFCGRGGSAPYLLQTWGSTFGAETFLGPRLT